jgi:hypothetical protein
MPLHALWAPRLQIMNEKFEVLTAVIMKIIFYSDVTLSLVDHYRYFGEMYIPSLLSVLIINIHYSYFTVIHS